jgi:putative inorganic carbon (hco3(-)) transporter
MVRIGVWKWTLGFVATHPLGGGFATYIINTVEVPGTGDQPAHIEFGRAFHSIYFEVLGEQGYPGFCVFLLLTGSTFITLRRLAKQARPHPELQWVVGFSDALQSGLAVFLSSGAFVGIAFQPMFWYFISMGICLKAYMWRVARQDDVAETGWRALSLRPALPPPVRPDPGDWRRRAARPGLNGLVAGPEGKASPLD